MQGDFLNHFGNVTDPRIDRTKRYPLMEVIFLIVSAVVSGCEGWKSIRDFGMMKLEWLRAYLPYENGIPVDDTIARLIRRLDTKEFESSFIDWMCDVEKATEGEVVAIDGKTLRRSYDKSAGKSAIHMVSAWSSANGVVLGQEKTDEKSNEITAIPALLNALAIKDCFVTIDAMGCQKAIAEQIVDKKADYLLALKGNQGNLHADVSDFFETAKKEYFANVEHDFYEYVDAGHGRIETRRAYAINVKRYKKCFPTAKEWKKLNSVVMVESEREMSNRKTTDTRFYITSSLGSAQTLLEASRKHWGVENSLHWTLDVTFREDESRIRKGASPENYAIFRHIALNILRKNVSEKASIKRKRHMAALSDNFRTSLISAVI